MPEHSLNVLAVLSRAQEPVVKATAGIKVTHLEGRPLDQSQPETFLKLIHRALGLGKMFVVIKSHVGITLSHSRDENA